MLQDQGIGIHDNDSADLLDDVLNRDDFRSDADGCIAALAGPGLDVEIDMERLEPARREPPHWRCGAIATGA